MLRRVNAPHLGPYSRRENIHDRDIRKLKLRLCSDQVKIYSAANFAG